jgi:hypothetical protein
MGVDSNRPHSSKGKWLRIAGAGIFVVAALPDLLVVGSYWWSDPGSSCDQLQWGDRIACVLRRPPMYVQMGAMMLLGWCVAGIALLVGRCLTPFVSFVVPGGVVALSIWGAIKYGREQGSPYWPLGLTTRESMILFAIMLSTLAMWFIGPVTGAWLAGYGMRRRRRSQMLRKSADVFD